MTKHDDGGPAYPVSVPADWHEKHGGMSLLDAFAGQVMVGILRNLEGLRPDDIPLMASDAYGIADAMIAEKRRREGGDTIPGRLRLCRERRAGR